MYSAKKQSFYGKLDDVSAELKEFLTCVENTTDAYVPEKELARRLFLCYYLSSKYKCFCGEDSFVFTAVLLFSCPAAVS